MGTIAEQQIFSGRLSERQCSLNPWQAIPRLSLIWLLQIAVMMDSGYWRHEPMVPLEIFEVSPFRALKVDR